MEIAFAEGTFTVARPSDDKRHKALHGLTLELPGLTLLSGLIEGHSHLLLHPYNETSWDEQVLNEPLALRTAATVPLRSAEVVIGTVSAAAPEDEPPGVRPARVSSP